MTSVNQELGMPGLSFDKLRMTGVGVIPGGSG